MAQWEEQGESEELVAMVKEVYEYIDQQRELGASVKDLKVRAQKIFRIYIQSGFDNFL